MSRALPNIIVTGTPGVGKSAHCEQLAQETKLKHLSINQIVREQKCYEDYDEELQTHIVDEDKLLDEIEDKVCDGGYLIDWHGCEIFPESWIDLVVVLNCPTTEVYHDRLRERNYSPKKLQENLDAEIFQVLLDEAREAFAEEIVVSLKSETTDDMQQNCDRIKAWIDAFVDKQHSSD